MAACTACIHSRSLQGGAAAAVDKCSDGGGRGNGVAGLLRQPWLCNLVLLSTTFWAVVFYFHSTMQGNMASDLLKPSSFSLPFLPSFRFGQDRCAGRYVYMYDLPPRFNADLARNCSTLSLSTDMCKLVVNGGLGPPLPPDGALPERRAYDTDQYMLEMIYHSRMRRHECLTSDYAAAAAVFVPFYSGFDAANNLWKNDLSARDALPRDLVDWLARRPEWRAMGGRDHFLVAARPTWDFVRGDDGGWGNALMTYPAIRNTTVLTMEASPWLGNDFGVPYPTSFHPSSDADVLTWQDRMRRSERRWLWAFAGAPRPSSFKTVRAQIIEQCSKSSRCARFSGSIGRYNPQGRILKLMESSEFCLQPRGDSYTRKSTFDSILAGCIPVFFHPASAYLQYTWYLPRDYRSYSVFIPHAGVTDRNVSIEETLRKIPPATVARMRETVIQLIPRLTYKDPTASMGTFKDAFDVAVEAVIDRVAKRRRAASEGRECRDSVDGLDCWKYNLLADGQKDIGPHEFDPYI